MSRTLFRDVRVFDPGSGLDHRGAVLVEGDRVLALDAPSDAPADRVVDGQGALLVPGLVDLRAHVGEPGFTERETIATATAAAAAGGFTAIVAMPSTSPPIDRVEVVEMVRARAREAGSTQVLPAGTLSENREGERLAEMAKLAAAGCVLFSDGNRAVRDSQLLRYALETADDIGCVVATHPEDAYLSLGGVMHEGQVSARLGLSGIPDTAEVVGVARDIALAELTGARLHLQHVSTAGAVELIREAKRRGARVTAEVSPCHLWLTDEALAGYDPMAKLVPPLRPAADRAAVIGGLADGTIDAVATDHAPRTRIEKNVEVDRAAPGAIGLESALGVILTLVDRGQLSLPRAISVLTRAPADILGRSDLGRLAEGGRADLALVDPARVWTFTEAAIRSRSRNTPLLGAVLRGRVRLTMAGGRVTHELRDAED
jgi:dihydroorotase